MRWHNVLVVLNPVAGTTDPRDVRAAVEEAFANRKGATYTLYETAKSDDVTAVVKRRLVAGFDLVIACGGDGTVSSVAAALVETDIAMAIIPTGTANAFARYMGISRDLAVATALVGGVSRLHAVDVMQCGTELFLLNIGVGLTARVMRGADRDAKSRFGFLAYVLSGFAALRTHRRRRIRITADGVGHEFSAVEVLVVNCPALGVPGVHIGEGVRVDDGRIDVFVFQPKRLFDYLLIVRSVLLTRERENPHITHLSVNDTLTVECDARLAVQGDGDGIASTPVTIRVLPRAVRIVVPAPGP